MKIIKKHLNGTRTAKFPGEQVDITNYLNDTSDPLTQVLMTYTDDKQYFAAYTYGLERIEVEALDETRPESQDPLYYLYDGLGSVAYMVKPDGNVRDRYNYDEYGKPAPGNSKLSPDGAINLHNTFGYTGEMWDEESNLLYLRARYYEPETGRMLSEDPARHGLNWYIYCYNNPLRYTDPSGWIPSAMEAALMADHIYTHDTSNTRAERTIMNDGVDTGWRLIDVWYGREGMKMGIYVRGDEYSSYDGPKEYAIVNKGTTPSNLGDWQNNVEQLFSAKSADMWDSINYGKRFVSSYSCYEITFVGHSKGGAEAAAMAVATNKNAILFNPATTNLGDYGLSSSTYSSSMTAYIVEGDIVNHLEGWFSKPIDKAVYLPQQYGGHWYEAWQTSYAQRVQNHLMGAVISALREEGYR